MQNVWDRSLFWSRRYTHHWTMVKWLKVMKNNFSTELFTNSHKSCNVYLYSAFRLPYIYAKLNKQIFSNYAAVLNNVKTRVKLDDLGPV